METQHITTRLYINNNNMLQYNTKVLLAGEITNKKTICSEDWENNIATFCHKKNPC